MSMKIDSHWLISISFRYNEKYWQKYKILEIPFPVHLSSSSSLDDCRVLPTCCCWQGSLRVSRQSAWRISRIPLTSWFTSSTEVGEALRLGTTPDRSRAEVSWGSVGTARRPLRFYTKTKQFETALSRDLSLEFKVLKWTKLVSPKKTLKTQRMPRGILRSPPEPVGIITRRDTLHQFWRRTPHAL